MSCPRGRPPKPHGSGNKHCCYGTCNNDSREKYKKEGVGFIPFPKPCIPFRMHEYTGTESEHARNCQPCSKAQKWLLMCRRQDGKFQKLDDITRSTYICNTHFVGGNGPTRDYPDPICATIATNQVRNTMNIPFYLMNPYEIYNTAQQNSKIFLVPSVS